MELIPAEINHNSSFSVESGRPFSIRRYVYSLGRRRSAITCSRPSNNTPVEHPSTSSSSSSSQRNAMQSITWAWGKPFPSRIHVGGHFRQGLRKTWMDMSWPFSYRRLARNVNMIDSLVIPRLGIRVGISSEVGRISTGIFFCTFEK